MSTPSTQTATARIRRTAPVTRTRRVAVAVSALTLAGLTCGAIVAPASAAPSAAPLLAPYYSALDVTGDRQVTEADLAAVAAALGATSASPEWASVSAADVDADGVITVSDLAAVSQRMVYDDGDFELVEADVIDMQAAMNAGVTTSVAITTEYLERIAFYDDEKIDPAEAGRALNSILATNKEAALAAAAAADAERAESGMTSMLLGVPVAVKDNYDTVDMPTTAGYAGWRDNQTTTDAAMVEGLRADGAVIVAKASLDEFAFGFSSAYGTGAGGQALVASPYLTQFSAGGSSGGTGAAIAANLAGIGFGSDTGGSIRVPSSYNQLVGIRPTVGLASRDGIVPLALSQDTGGPMTRSVVDAAVALDAVVGVDAADPITAEQSGLVPESYTESLDSEALQGARIGYVSSMVPTNATALRLWNDAVATLTAQGATVVNLSAEPAFVSDYQTDFTRVLNESSGSTNEFKHDLEIYAQQHLAANVPYRTLQQIVDSGEIIASRQGTYEGRNRITAQQYDDWAGPGGSHTEQLATGKVQVHELMTDFELDAIAYPSGTPYGTHSTNMRLSPNTGMPSITVPMGQASATEARTGAGVNLELLGRDYAEGTLIGLAYAYEQATHHRTSPILYGPLG